MQICTSDSITSLQQVSTLCSSGLINFRIGLPDRLTPKAAKFLLISLVLLSSFFASFGAAPQWAIKTYQKSTCTFPTGQDLTTGLATTAGAAPLYAIVMASDGTVLQTQQIGEIAPSINFGLFFPRNSGDGYTAADTTNRLYVPTLTYTSFIFAVSSTRPAVGSVNPTLMLPTGWLFTGSDAYVDEVNGSPGTIQLDGAPYGIINVSQDISQVYFNINKIPVANPYTAASQVNPGAAGTGIPAAAFSGSDFQNGTYAAGLMGLPVTLYPATNGTLFYNNAPVTAATLIASYDASLVKLVPTPLIGSVTSSFEYSVKDAACAFSANAVVTVLFTNAALPVDLISFTAQVINNQTVQLDWVTASELNNHYFLLEHSKDIQTFNLVSQVMAKEGQAFLGHNYTHIDQTPYEGTSYYRLKQVDLNGTVTNYPAVAIVLRSDSYGVYPNPVSGQRFTLRLDEPQTAKVTLHNAEGRVIELQKGAGTDGTLELTMGGKGSAGIYILTVEERGTTRTYRLVVQ